MASDGIFLTEFLAEDELVNIVPNQRLDAIRLAKAAYGPFKPLIQARVPVWMAISLKSKGRCKIVCPEWLEEEQLKERILEEKSGIPFSHLPFHYVEIGLLLLNSASDDIPHSESIRQYLRDLQELRDTKIRSGLDSLDSHYLQMDDLGCFELETIRPIFAAAFNTMRELTI